MRRDLVNLRWILESADELRQHLDGVTADGFRNDRMLQHVARSILLNVGEAATRISPELRARHPEIEWREIVAFRNILVHGYLGIEWMRVWESARSELPALAARVRDILATDFADEAE